MTMPNNPKTKNRKLHENFKSWFTGREEEKTDTSNPHKAVTKEQPSRPDPRAALEHFFPNAEEDDKKLFLFYAEVVKLQRDYIRPGQGHVFVKSFVEDMGPFITTAGFDYATIKHFVKDLAKTGERDFAKWDEEDRKGFQAWAAKHVPGLRHPISGVGIKDVDPTKVKSAGTGGVGGLATVPDAVSDSAESGGEAAAAGKGGEKGKPASGKFPVPIYKKPTGKEQSAGAQTTGSLSSQMMKQYLKHPAFAAANSVVDPKTGSKKFSDEQFAKRVITQILKDVEAQFTTNNISIQENKTEFVNLLTAMLMNEEVVAGNRRKDSKQGLEITAGAMKKIRKVYIPMGYDLKPGSVTPLFRDNLPNVKFVQYFYSTQGPSGQLYLAIAKQSKGKNDKVRAYDNEREAAAYAGKPMPSRAQADAIANFTTGAPPQDPEAQKSATSNVKEYRPHIAVLKGRVGKAYNVIARELYQEMVKQGLAGQGIVDAANSTDARWLGAYRMYGIIKKLLKQISADAPDAVPDDVNRKKQFDDQAPGRITALVKLFKTMRKPANFVNEESEIPKETNRTDAEELHAQNIAEYNHLINWMQDILDLFVRNGIDNREKAAKLIRAGVKARAPGSKGDAKGDANSRKDNRVAPQVKQNGSMETPAEVVARLEKEVSAGKASAEDLQAAKQVIKAAAAQAGSAGTMNVRQSIGPRLKGAGVDLSSPEGSDLQKKMLKHLKWFLYTNMEKLGISTEKIKVIAENKKLQGLILSKFKDNLLERGVFSND